MHLKGGVHLENLDRLKAIAFNKTGTITNSQPIDGYRFPQWYKLDGASRSRRVRYCRPPPLAQAMVRSG